MDQNETLERSSVIITAPHRIKRILFEGTDRPMPRPYVTLHTVTPTDTSVQELFSGLADSRYEKVENGSFGFVDSYFRFSEHDFSRHQFEMFPHQSPFQLINRELSLIIKPSSEQHEHESRIIHEGLVRLPGLFLLDSKKEVSPPKNYEEYTHGVMFDSKQRNLPFRLATHYKSNATFFAYITQESAEVLSDQDPKQTYSLELRLL